MRHPTPHIRRLRRVLSDLSPLISRVNPLICDSPLQVLKVRSYILLSHAALEEYLEELVLDVAVKSRQLFKEKGYITKALVGMISSGLIEEIADGKAKKKVVQDL